MNIVPRKMDKRGGGGRRYKFPPETTSLLQWLYLVVHLSFEARFCQLRLDLTTEYRLFLFFSFVVSLGCCCCFVFHFFFFEGRSAVRNGITPSNLLRQWPLTLQKSTVSEYALQKDRPTMNI